MKTNKSIHLATRGILIICFAFLFFIIVRIGAVQILLERLHVSIENPVMQVLFFDNTEVKNVYQTENSEQAKYLGKDQYINWEELYPYENAESMEEDQNGLNNIKKKILAFEKKIEKYCTEQLIFYKYIVQYALKYEKLLGWDLVSNHDESVVVEMQNDSLTYIMEEKDISKCSENLLELSKYVKENGSEFLYIQAPYKNEEQYMPPMYRDFTDKNTDVFLKTLEENEIDYYDLRTVLKESDKEYSSYFFLTDHHWLPETGLDMTKNIVSYINSKYNYAIDESLYNIENYEIEKYDTYLGSCGRKVTLEKTELEPISLITPSFPTNLHVRIPEYSIDVIGDFSDTMIDYKQIDGEDFYSWDKYAAYGWANRGLIYSENLNKAEKKKLLVIKDSFANTVVPYLSLGVSEISEIDLRHFNGSLETYIKEYNPDLVLVLYNPHALKDSNEINDNDKYSLWNFK